MMLAAHPRQPTHLIVGWLSLESRRVAVTQSQSTWRKAGDLSGCRRRQQVSRLQTPCQQHNTATLFHHYFPTHALVNTCPFNLRPTSTTSSFAKPLCDCVFVLVL
eukprot:m.116548 g.116548  ORF g.116548 m.116548 type:complete len:105 (+) comp16380_c0_seq1:229-543(+)